MVRILPINYLTPVPCSSGSGVAHCKKLICVVSVYRTTLLNWTQGVPVLDNVYVILTFDITADGMIGLLLLTV